VVDLAALSCARLSVLDISKEFESVAGRLRLRDYILPLQIGAPDVAFPAATACGSVTPPSPPLS